MSTKHNVAAGARAVRDRRRRPRSEIVGYTRGVATPKTHGARRGGRAASAPKRATWAPLRRRPTRRHAARGRERPPRGTRAARGRGPRRCGRRRAGTRSATASTTATSSVSADGELRGDARRRGRRDDRHEDRHGRAATRADDERTDGRGSPARPGRSRRARGRRTRAWRKPPKMSDTLRSAPRERSVVDEEAPAAPVGREHGRAGAQEERPHHDAPGDGRGEPRRRAAGGVRAVARAARSTSASQAPTTTGAHPAETKNATTDATASAAEATSRGGATRALGEERRSAHGGERGRRGTPSPSSSTGPRAG